MRFHPQRFLRTGFVGVGMVLLTLGSWCGGAAETDSVRVAAVLRQPPSSGQPLILEFRFTIAPGVHVYTADSHFFKYVETDVAELGPATVELPPTQSIRDLLADDPTATTPVMAGNVSVRVTKPLLGAGGAAWRLAGNLTYQACTETTCFPPEKVPFAFGAAAPSGEPAAAIAAAAAAPDAWGGRSLAWGVVAAFVAGLLLSFTPCVYPMIGITVAVIGGRQGGRRRTLWLTFLYVLGLSVTYALSGVVIALLGSAIAVFLRSAWVLVPIGLVFLAMGLSMFDLFTIATPSALAGRLQVMGRQGSAWGVLAMGAVSAFVVGPCVSGPLLSLVTYVAASGRVLAGFLYFFALAWGMGCVLFLAGSASGWLPKAGGWMETVKHALGMILIWAAFYFTRPLIGETAFAIASLTCIAVGTGMLGLLRSPSPGSGRAVLQWTRLACGVLIIALAAHHFLTSRGGEAGLPPLPSEVQMQIAQARREGRPALLDFWAPWCAICKEIERQVLQNPAMQEKLRNVSLIKVNVDDQPELVKQYGIIGPPAFVFLDAAGQQVGAVTVTAEELERRLTNGW